MPINPYQRNVMYSTNPAQQGPTLPWMPMPEEDPQQQGLDLKAIGGGVDSLLKRFKKPEGFGGGTPGGTDLGRAIKLPGFSGGAL